MHDRIGLAPVPERINGEAGVEFAAALVQVFDGGTKKEAD
jgi:hypothetical protein